MARTAHRPAWYTAGKIREVTPVAYTIGIDLGTSASKFLLVDEAGRVLITVTKD